MRVKRGVMAKKAHKKVLKMAKGYRGSKSRHFKHANEQLLHSLSYAYNDRKDKKRNFRSLWILRINAGLRQYDLSYSKFINLLKKLDIDINRKMLSQMAAEDSVAFGNLVKQVTAQN